MGDNGAPLLDPHWSFVAKLRQSSEGQDVKTQLIIPKEATGIVILFVVYVSSDTFLNGLSYLCSFYHMYSMSIFVLTPRGDPGVTREIILRIPSVS